MNHKANLSSYYRLHLKGVVTDDELARMVATYTRIHRDGLRPVDAVIESKNSRPQTKTVWGELF